MGWLDKYQDGGRVVPYRNAPSNDAYDRTKPLLMITKQLAPAWGKDIGDFLYDMKSDRYRSISPDSYGIENALDEQDRLKNLKGDIKINDIRNVASNRKMSHNVNSETVRKLVKGSLEKGINPNTVLAMALQETGISNINPLYQVHIDGQWMNEGYTPQTIEDADLINKNINFLSDKIKYAEKLGKTQEADIIQAWNGYGKMPPGYYGRKDTIDMDKDPVYGNRIVALRDSAILTTPEIQNIIKEEQLNFKNGGKVKYQDGGEVGSNSKKKTIKVFAETPMNEGYRYDLENTRILPDNLKKLQDEFKELKKDRFPEHRIGYYLRKYIEGYYLSRRGKYSNVQGDPYTQGFRAGTYQEPYYDDPNDTRDLILEYLDKGLNTGDFSQLKDFIKDDEPGLNLKGIDEYNEAVRRSKYTENRLTEILNEFYNQAINPIVKELNNTFVTEANNLKKVFKNNPNIQIDVVPIYGEQDTIKIKQNIKGLTADDDLIIMGHTGNRFGGIDNKWWNENIKDSEACKYLGACGAEDVVKNQFKDNNMIYRPNNAWLGVNPRSENLQDAMFSRFTSPTGDTTRSPIKGVDYEVQKKYKSGGQLKKPNQMRNFTNGWVDKYL